MSTPGEQRIRELTQRMLRKKLYVVLSKGAASAEQIGAVLPQHLEYMIGLEKSGVLFASVGHGSAFDIAGKESADPEALIRTLLLMSTCGAAASGR